jgi:D-serine deaminase-like pyridoxal phosphate-dependent protein
MTLAADLYPDLDTPQALIDLDVVDRNVAAMLALGRDRGVNVRVHFKSLKCGSLAKYLRGPGSTRSCARS